MLNEALRLIRVFHNLKQNQLSSDLDLSPSYLSEIESGTKEPSVALLQKYSARFGIPTSSILLFSESLDQEGSKARKLRKTVAGKILAILQWIEVAKPQSAVHVRH